MVLGGCVLFKVRYMYHRSQNALWAAGFVLEHPQRPADAQVETGMPAFAPPWTIYHQDIQGQDRSLSRVHTVFFLRPLTISEPPTPFFADLNHVRTAHTRFSLVWPTSQGEGDLLVFKVGNP
jgi:hypothetical protein